jgi:hypothetical protein
MGQSMGSGGKTTTVPRGKIQQLGGNGRLVVDQVEIVRQREVIKVPELVIEEKPTIKYIPEEQPTVKYNATEIDTVKYNVTEKETIKYEAQSQETIKYVPREVECEKPVLIDKPYERPVVVDKEYTIVTFKDMEAIRELMDLAPKLLSQLKALKDTKIVEEIIKVPKIQYVPTTIKRVKDTGELIDDAN